MDSKGYVTSLINGFLARLQVAMNDDAEDHCLTVVVYDDDKPVFFGCLRPTEAIDVEDQLRSLKHPSALFDHELIEAAGVMGEEITTWTCRPRGRPI